MGNRQHRRKAGNKNEDADQPTEHWSLWHSGAALLEKCSGSARLRRFPAFGQGENAGVHAVLLRLSVLLIPLAKVELVQD